MDADGEHQRQPTTSAVRPPRCVQSSTAIIRPMIGHQDPPGRRTRRASNMPRAAQLDHEVVEDRGGAPRRPSLHPIPSAAAFAGNASSSSDGLSN